MIFDRSEGTPWEDKLYRRLETDGGAPVTVWGMLTCVVPALDKDRQFRY